MTTFNEMEFMDVEEVEGWKPASRAETWFAAIFLVLLIGALVAGAVILNLV